MSLNLQKNAAKVVSFPFFTILLPIGIAKNTEMISLLILSICEKVLNCFVRVMGKSEGFGWTVCLKSPMKIGRKMNCMR